MDEDIIHTVDVFVVKHTDKDGKVNWVQDRSFNEPVLFSEQNAINTCISPAYTAHKVRVTYTLLPD